MYLLGVAYDHVYYKFGVEKDRGILLHVPQCDTLMAFRRVESVRGCEATLSNPWGCSRMIRPLLCHSPPCIGKLDSIKTITLTPPHIIGSHVDIRKFPDS